MFETFRRWRDSRSALAELERMQAREGAAFGFLIEEKLAESLNALGRGDRTRAARLWDEALAAAPAVAKRAPEAIHVLLGLDRADEAEAMMLDGQRRFPAEPSFAAGHAYVAAHRNDYEEALRRWEAMRAKFPRAPESFRQGAEALGRLGRLDEAERLLGEAVGSLPGDLLLFIAHAQIASRRQDWPAALQRWKQVERFGHPSSISGQAEALRHMGQIDEADGMLARARFAHPLEPELALEYARIADSRADWPEAARRWADAIKRFPLLHYVYREAAESRLKAGDEAGAEAVTAEARERFEAAGEPPPEESEPAADEPDELGRLRAAARAAFERGDPNGEALAGEEIGRRFPGDRSGLFHHARGLRNAERIAETEELLADAPTRFGDDISLLSIWTSLPRSSGDVEEALRRARWLLERFPEDPSPYTHLARWLIGAGRAEEARGVAEDGLRRWPQDLGLNDSRGEAAAALAHAASESARRDAHAAVEHGYAALRERAWTDAERHFEGARTLLPLEPGGWLGGAEALREQGRLTEADALLAAGIEVLPHEPRLSLAHAELPAVQFLGEARDWDAALARTAALCGRFPAFEPGFALAVRLLRDAGRAADADAAAGDAVRRFPDSSDMLIEQARAAAGRGDFDLAARRFGDVRARFPDYWPGYAGLAETLCRLGRFDEAEEEARAAVQRFPDEPMVLAESAHVAARRNDPGEALRRWQQARERFPEVSWVSHRLFEAQLRMADVDPESGNPGLAPTAEAPRETLADILLDFESLGGTHLGCEFGLVQRAAGVEPLGLLRWTDMTYDDLVRLLEAEFEGVGLPENTELIVPDHDGRAEYTSRDRRFNMRMHTFVARDDAPPDRMHAQLCRRLRFLRDKLLADLRAGSKIFVFKQTTRNLEPAEIDRLHSTLRAYGPATLLYVRYSDAGHPPGTVAMPREGLLVGALDRFAMGPDAEPCGEQNAAWNDICRAAHAMWRPSKAQAA